MDKVIVTGLLVIAAVTAAVVVIITIGPSVVEPQYARYHRPQSHAQF